jgi:hypothetical protein
VHLWLLLLFIAGGTSSLNVGHLASLRLTTTEAETHNERLCAHTLGDQHCGHVAWRGVAQRGAKTIKKEQIVHL